MEKVEMPLDPTTALATIQIVQVFFFRVLSTIADYSYPGQFWGWAWSFIWNMIERLWSFLYRLAAPGTKIGTLRILP